MEYQKTEIPLKDNVNNQRTSGFLITPGTEQHFRDAGKWQAFIKTNYQNASQDAHWLWHVKFLNMNSQPSIEMKTYVIEKDDMVQGVMMLKLNKCKSKRYRRREIVYVDYLATAPWNRKYENFNGEIVTPKYSLVGLNLIKAAIEESHSKGYDGLVGLSSLSKAEDFYKGVGFCQVGENIGECGLNYFELKL